uniref:FGENESH: predicted gene_5.556 protein n=1 Tax=Rhodotorula toruloides TaxID=5286 RepID=A0A0K3CF47_RHOTO
MTSTALSPDPLRYLPLVGWMTANLLDFDYASMQAKFTITPRPAACVLIAIEIWLYYWLIQRAWGLFLRIPHVRPVVAEAEVSVRICINVALRCRPTAGTWAVKTWIGSCVSHTRGRLAACNVSRPARETSHLRFILDMRILRLICVFLRFDRDSQNASISFDQAQGAAEACIGSAGEHALRNLAQFLEPYVPAWTALAECPANEVRATHVILCEVLSTMPSFEDQLANAYLTNDFASVTVTRVVIAAQNLVEQRWRILNFPHLFWELVIHILLKEIERVKWDMRSFDCPSQALLFEMIAKMLTAQQHPTYDFGLVLVPYLQARVAEDAALKREPELHRAILDTLLVRNELKQRLRGSRDDKREAGSLRRSD